MKKRSLQYLILLIVLIILVGMYRMFTVKGWSDLPNIKDNTKVIINTAAYSIPVPFTLKPVFRTRDPQRNDVVLFRGPESSGNILIVKRIVAIPGDLVEIRNQELAINGKEFNYIFQFNKDYSDIPKDKLQNKLIAIEKSSSIERLVALDEKDNKSANFEALLIPEGHYFILGDNRSYSQDSRHYGPIPRESILGKLVTSF